VSTSVDTMPVKEFRKCATVAGLSVLWIAGAPWWAVFLLSVMGFAVACLQAVLPQESAHRLAWWRDRRKARARLRPPPRRPQGVRGRPR
jgi:hypothetical protein